jgi:hypothetical protein
MATKQTTATEKSTTTIPEGAPYLGTDTAGREHYAGVFPADKTIYVVADDGVTTVEYPTIERDTDTAIETPGDWADYVSARWGWADCRVGTSLVDMLADSLEGQA